MSLRQAPRWDGTFLIDVSCRRRDMKADWSTDVVVWNKAKWATCKGAIRCIRFIEKQPSQMWKRCDGDPARRPRGSSDQLRQSRCWQLRHNRTCSNTTRRRGIMSALYLPRGAARLRHTPLRWGSRLVSIYKWGLTAADGRNPMKPCLMDQKKKTF